MDADLAYSKENLLCWIRVLKNNGLLLMERIDEKTPEILTALFPDLLTFHENPNLNVWIFSKKAPDVAELQSKIIQAISEKAPINRLLPLLDKMEYASPHSVLPHFIRSKLFHNTPSVSQESWQCLSDRTLSSVMDIYAALNTLSNGDYQIGFQQRERVLGHTHLRRTPTPPSEKFYEKRWKGEDLAGKTIVVWTEFGLGDEIMFAQLAYYFKTQGATVKWIVQSPIVSLISTHPDIDWVIDSTKLKDQSIDQSKLIGEFDYWVYPHEILAYVSTPFPRLPKRLPYLFADPNMQKNTILLFPDTGNLKVGIVWRGDPTHENDAYRSIHHLGHIETLFQMEGIDWYCVQKSCNEQEVQLLEKYNVPNIAKNAKDFAETATMLPHLDCLVSVDTSVVHVAGAMGIPSLLMLPYIGDWRWGLVESNNLWYPTVQLFRCPTPLPVWDRVIEEIQQALIERIDWKQ
ncbi:glycosyltransferase family 9 protein [Rodentibacter ratti]|uniref:glycosyltransferase family 9 protein n=1 Tax=Rodentibacter ratti TaxID=1906745 RepID=UPI00117B25F5|nr:glycosyltransferase family 9 protein [Rodentibacter ratti]